MTKRLFFLFATIIAVIAPVALYIHVDSRAIEMRNSKATELSRVADRLGTADMKTVLLKLGSPSRVALQDVAGLSSVHATAPHVLIFTYEYTFKSVPWSAPQRVWLTFRFNIEHTRVTSASVDQTFS